MEASGSKGKRPEEMDAGENGERPFTRHQKKQEEDKKRKVAEEEQREAKRLNLFKPRKVIGPRDIKVNRGLGKIHVVEEFDVKPEVKLEPIEGDWIGLKEPCGGGEQEGDRVVIVKEEVDLPLDLEVEMETEDPVGFQRKEEEEEEVAQELAGIPAGYLEQMDDIGGEASTPARNGEFDENFALGESSEMNHSPCSCSDEALRRENQLLKERIQFLEKQMQELMNNSGNLEVAEEGVSTQKGCQHANKLKANSESIAAASMDVEDDSSVVGTGDKTADEILPDLQSDAARMELVAKMVNHLFPEVAKIIWKKYGTSELSVQDFLTARLVNTEWKNGVDQIPQGPINLLQIKRNVLVPICCLEHTQEFMAKLKQDAMVPQSTLSFTTIPNCQYWSVTKFGEIRVQMFGPQDKRPEHREVITNLIKQFGSNISRLNYFEPLKCHLAMHNLFENCVDWYAALVEWLQLMPNLGFVYAYCHMRDINPKELSNLIKSEPFPKLPQVKKVSTMCIPAQVLRSLLLSNCQVSILDISPSPNYLYGEVLNTTDLNGNTLPNLTALRIICRDVSDENFVKNLQHLDAPSLKTFSLKGDSQKDEPYTSSVIHRVFRKFQSTLQYVNLDVTLHLEHEHFKRFPDLPILKLLSLKFNCVLKNPNRLTRLVEPLQNLECLELREDKDSDQPECTGHQRRDLNNDLVSRLWELIPKLRNVFVLSVHQNSKWKRNDFIRQVKSSSSVNEHIFTNIDNLRFNL